MPFASCGRADVIIVTTRPDRTRRTGSRDFLPRPLSRWDPVARLRRPAATAGGPDEPRSAATTSPLLARHLGKGPAAPTRRSRRTRSAIAIDPRSAELRAELARAYACQDNAVEAVATPRRRPRARSSNQEANRILGTVYAASPSASPPHASGRRVSTYRRARLPRSRRRWAKAATSASTCVLGRSISADRRVPAVPPY